LTTRKEYPVISDLAIHKLLAICTTYLCDAAISKLVIIKPKNQCFLKNVENAFLAALANVSTYEWIICLKIKCIHPISCVW